MHIVTKAIPSDAAWKDTRRCFTMWYVYLVDLFWGRSPFISVFLPTDWPYRNTPLFFHECLLLFYCWNVPSMQFLREFARPLHCKSEYTSVMQTNTGVTTWGPATVPQNGLPKRLADNEHALYLPFRWFLHWHAWRLACSIHIRCS